MLQNLQIVIELINNNNSLSQEEKTQMIASLKEADKKFSITEFKLDRTEKVKRTTAILLEETIEELENKRKAVEAQNRELEIEAALERVRGVALSMKEPADMLEICRTISKQLELLHVKEIRNVQTAIFYESKGTYMNYEYYAKHDKTFITETSYTNNKIHLEFAEKMLKGNGEFMVAHIKDDEVKDWIAYQKTTNVFIDENLNTASSLNYYWYSLGPVALGISTYEPLKEEDINLFKRFLKVFELSYTRYLDIEQAIAQARESQIQLALERVRARTMAMQHSDELSATASEMFRQIQLLGLKTWSCGFNIIDKEKRLITQWVSSGDGRILPAFITPSDEDVFQRFTQAAEKDKSLYVEEMGGEALKAHYQYMASLPEVKKMLVEFQSLEITPPDFQVFHLASFSYGYLMFITYQPALEFYDVFKRFATVFDQTYTRFLDLQKAEAQTREAQIEAALERVRSSSIAMRNSNDLHEVIKIVTEQLLGIGVKFDNASFVKVDEEGNWDLYISTPIQSYPSLVHVPYFKNAMFKTLSDAIAAKQDFYARIYSFEEKNDFFNHFFKNTIAKHIPDERKQFVMNSAGYSHSVFITGDLWLGISNYQATAYSDEENAIIKRFANVFQQAYTRFLDLQRAEAQAREANIEAALERVRARTMAMQSSNELAELVINVFTELTKLDISLTRCAIGIMNNDGSAWREWTAEPDESAQYYDIKSSGFTYHVKLIKNWEARKEKWIYHLEGEEMRLLTNYLIKESDYSSIPEPAKEIMLNTKAIILSHSFSNFGFIRTDSLASISNESLTILSRFTKVFEQTYTRFLDLKKAEAAAKDALKQSALDRIRADIASMRTVSDLNRITPLIWNELTILGIPFIRCGVFIMNDEQHLIYTFLSTPDGKAIAAFQIPYNSPGNIKHVISHWRHNKNYIDHWDENAFTEFAETLVIQGALTSPDQYLKTIPHGGFYLHFLPFLQGMLYVGNINKLSDEEINLTQAVADAFSAAYARYEDFNKLEAAKQQVEKTLSELKQAQQQLVQSEKMASLGELTAGIAHEIQNPLNFVNNFSEVNIELIEELKTKNEKLKIEDDEIKELLGNLTDNEEKINHHGKRADAIVKGMLQHSRKNSGQKEPADINALCDEYLRLSFHGMRAKDKNFNADFKTDFDESIGKINIVPQDMGRVLLNLCNNAFYAVNEKLTASRLPLTNNYKTLVSVKTKRIKDDIEIIVRDNGNGIPQNIIDKIFQPFFTTKPTGQGTGLGLSLAYDIITKEHNGTIKVESKEGEGSTFIINLPIK